MSPALRRPDMRRAVVLLPNGFTLGNLFFGVFALVSATRGAFVWAGWSVVLSGVMDLLDGRVARMTRTGSRFGVELDSLVDVISFGVAPAMIMYFAVLNRDGWGWLFSFFFIACAVMRLARFNIEQGGRAKTHFHGLPSPVAGMTLATYYWFSQTSLYTQTNVAGWPWHTIVPGLMLVLSFLMISHVLYPALATVRVKSVRSLVEAFGLLALVVGVLVRPYAFAFPALVAYIAFGLGKTFLLGLIERAPTGDPLFDDVDEYEGENGRPVTLGEMPGGERRRRRRGRRSIARTPERTPTLRRHIDERTE
ncbi:MAG TPA: CDP-diacylglycerol--serine O-phosphatidyltransferase [Gemmatimonadaceae bacterium]|nr:CDP-diacylglycerol--serine O-phosphatidyltransferase [Gemmatimonadaceae bacterium]